MVAQAISGGQTVTFTKLRTSSYQYPSGTDYAALTSLIGVQQETDITYASTTDPKNVKVNATVTNAGVLAAYTIRNLGIYAQIGSETETLFAVIPAIVGDTVPVYSDTTRVSYIFSITIAVGTATGLTVNVTTAGMASVIDLQDTENDIYENLTPIIASSQVVENASGTIATFADGADGAPMRSIKVTITPEQDLHGQDAPYPAGGGKNLAKPYVFSSTSADVTFQYDGSGRVTLNGTANAYNAIPTISVAVSNGFWFSLPAGTYIPSITPSGDVTIEVYDVDAVTLLSNGAAFTTNEEKRVLVRVGVVTNKTYSNKTYTIQLESGSTATAYAPYSNICPISGRSAVRVWRGGANLIDDTNWGGYSNEVTLGVGTWYAQAFVSGASEINTRLQFLKEGVWTDIVLGTDLADYMTVTPQDAEADAIISAEIERYVAGEQTMDQAIANMDKELKARIGKADMP